MPFKQFGEAPHHGSANHYNQDAAVAGVIDEDFLNQPPARQRAMLHRATGDRSLLSMSDEGTDRYITNAINQIEARDIGGAHAASPMHAQDGAEGVDPQLMQAMEQAAGADDMQAANSLLRSAKRRSGGQRDVRHEHSSRRPASGGQRFDAGRIRSALGLPESAAYNPAGSADATPSVSTIDHRGTVHQVPHDQLPEALAAGHTVVMPMTSPDGHHGYVPLQHLESAHHHGFEMGHRSAGDSDMDPQIKNDLKRLTGPRGLEGEARDQFFRGLDGQRVGNFTVGELSNVLTNESRDLSGGKPGVLDEAKRHEANAILDNARLRHPNSMASRTLSSGAAHSQGRDQDMRIMRQVYYDRMTGEDDPVEGRTFFGNSAQDLGSRPIGDSRQSVYDAWGPFKHG